MNTNENVVSVHQQGIEVMSIEYSRAVQADDFVNNGLKLAQIGITQMCAGVKMMHDGKLYKQFGFKNFEEYCKSKGFSEKGGRRLVKIAEMLEQEKNRTSLTDFSKLGVTVLGLLATLEPEQRDELAQNVDLETCSTRDIEKEIKVIKAQHKADIEIIKKQHQEVLDRRKSKYETNIKEQYEMLEQAQRTCENYRERMKAAKEKAENLTGHIVNLERQIQKLESAPKDVSVAIPAEITEKLQELTIIKGELEQKKASLETELQKTKDREQEAKAEAERIQNVSAEAVAKSKKQMEQLQAEITELKSQSSDSGAEPDVKELFRPYFQACTHSIGLMMNFISKQKNSPDFTFLTSKASQVAEAIESQLQALRNQSE